MRTALLLIGAVLAASAHADPITDPQRAAAARREAAQQARIQQAQARCNANRGTDCDTIDGLQEWLLLDRSRADAVLDRFPTSSSAGASLPPVVTPGVPETSPRNVPSGQ